MADSLKAMRDLIVQETQIDEGEIVSINDDGDFLVSTKIGIQVVSGDSTFFQVGDSVKVLDGAITFKKSTEEDDLVVHER